MTTTTRRNVGPDSVTKRLRRYLRILWARAHGQQSRLATHDHVTPAGEWWSHRHATILFWHQVRAQDAHWDSWASEGGVAGACPCAWCCHRRVSRCSPECMRHHKYQAVLDPQADGGALVPPALRAAIDAYDAKPSPLAKLAARLAAPADLDPDDYHETGPL